MTCGWREFLSELHIWYVRTQDSSKRTCEPNEWHLINNEKKLQHCKNFKVNIFVKVAVTMSNLKNVPCRNQRNIQIYNVQFKKIQIKQKSYINYKEQCKQEKYLH